MEPALQARVQLVGKRRAPNRVLQGQGLSWSRLRPPLSSEDCWLENQGGSSPGLAIFTGWLPDQRFNILKRPVDFWPRR
jgi:hypothetical protein